MYQASSPSDFGSIAFTSSHSSASDDEVVDAAMTAEVLKARLDGRDN